MFCLFPFVPFLKDVEGFLLLALVGEEALAVVVVLDIGQHTTRGAEVLQNPGSSA